MHSLSKKTLEIVREVIHTSGAELPADAALRSAFRYFNNLAQEERAAVSESVFAFFRWRGWLPRKLSLEEGIRAARKLAERFARDPGEIPVDEFAKNAVPEWLHEEMDVSQEWLQAIQEPPPLWLRARGDASDLAESLSGCEAGPVENAFEYVGERDLYREPAFTDGLVEIQDLSSQAVSHICAPTPGSQWWDACCGEGGKTMHLADLMGGKGLLWGTDRSRRRLGVLKKRAARAKVYNYRSKPWTYPSPPTVKALFDGVLLDAPCSGVGVWNRNPHARWTTQQSDVAELADIQFGMLQSVARQVKPGGVLVYSVCTLTKKETDVVADGFERVSEGFVPEPFACPITGDQIESGRTVIAPPGIRGGGMFIARWRREN